MKTTDILAIEGWKELVEQIYAKFGLNGTVNDKEGMLIYSSSKWANQICPAIKGNKDTRVVCASAQQSLSKMAHEKKQPASEECDAGFVKFVVPIFYKGEFLGTTGGCGRLVEGGEINSFYIAKLLNMNEGEVEGLLVKVEKIAEGNLESAIKYVQEQIEKILKDLNRDKT